MIARRACRPGHPYFAGAPLLMAHRGGAALAPENTMAAFRRAVDEYDADVLEMDVRLAADGRLVVIHDETVDRTTDGTGLVREKDWNQLRRLDAGCRFRDPSGVFSFRGTGVRLCLFEEVLDAFPNARINVEPKAAEAAAPLLAAVRSHGATHRVLVGAVFEATRRGARGHAGPWGASRRQLAPLWFTYRLPFVGRWHLPAADAFQVSEKWGAFPLLTPSLVRAAHRRNIPVHAWVVNDPADMRRLLAWGVDGIQTDRPDLLASVLAEVTGRPQPGRQDP